MINLRRNAVKKGMHCKHKNDLKKIKDYQRLKK